MAPLLKAPETPWPTARVNGNELSQHSRRESLEMPTSSDPDELASLLNVLITDNPNDFPFQQNNVQQVVVQSGEIVRELVDHSYPSAVSRYLQFAASFFGIFHQLGFFPCNHHKQHLGNQIVQQRHVSISAFDSSGKSTSSSEVRFDVRFDVFDSESGSTSSKFETEYARRLVGFGRLLKSAWSILDVAGQLGTLARGTAENADEDEDVDAMELRCMFELLEVMASFSNPNDEFCRDVADSRREGPTESLRDVVGTFKELRLDAGTDPYVGVPGPGVVLPESWKGYLKVGALKSLPFCKRSEGMLSVSELTVL
ncbi:hypothetical protein OGAPHI_003017 [Ogataea philodendri]|uniref:Uncharacterized protein n=1 Tax=Ogataea philodendri TaxID=1378263 RepID=A0A9P8T5U3_9ASCO|nr:uncharacterized protein OGAPHI_003017 [Ogataea philodendri]KAH3667368.1 hypothetical protein OGAPHI_003017 [Ogataea philodendri]